MNESHLDEDPAELLRIATASRKAGQFHHCLQLVNHAMMLQQARDMRWIAYKSSAFIVELVRLSEVYAPAKDELLKLQDESKSRVVRGDNVLENFRLFHSLCRVMHNVSAALELFEELNAKDRSVAKMIFPVVRQSLLRSRRYELASTYCDWGQIVEAAVEPLKRMPETTLKRPALVKRRWRKLLDEASQYVLMLSSVHRMAEAEQLAKIILTHAKNEGIDISATQIIASLGFDDC